MWAKGKEMTDELFDTKPEALVILKRCSCRKVKSKTGEKVDAPAEQQPCVYLRPALDKKWYAGSCHSCRKIYTERIA